MLQTGGFRVISANTDGVTSIVKKEKLEQFRQIYKKWENITMLEMEEAVYKKYVRRDVNNYIALTDYGKFKYKGVFDYNREPHKNHSMMIVPIALEKYFFEKVPVEQTITNHEDIFDFCKAVKATGDAHLELWTYKDGILNKETLQKTCRYYVSNTSSTLMKCMPPLDEKIKNPNQISLFDFVEDVKEDTPREHNVEKGYQIQLFNQSFLSDNYNINYDYYIEECNKIINVIENEHS